MSLSHYSFFPGDYMRDTMHLGWLEDCAYRRLLDLYYSRGMPIRNDRQYIMRSIRASEPEQQAAVDVVLSEFFVLQADGWHNAKADTELVFYRDKSEKARAAGRKSGEVRRASNPHERTFNGRSTDVEHPTPPKTKPQTLKPQTLLTKG